MDTIYGIDIGSNSVRLVKIVNGRTIYKLINTTQVSQDLSKNGYLKQEAMDRTLAAVEEFAGIAQEEKKVPFVFATEAFRSAENGRDFAKQINEKCKVKVDIISGELEARLGYIGAGGLYKRSLTVIDIGGASTELVCGRGNNLSFVKSVPVGIVALKDNCGMDKDKLINYIDEKISQYGDIKAEGRCYGIGGTSTSLAAIDLKLEKYNALKVNGHCISLRRLNKMIDMLLCMSVEEIKKVPGVQEKRADVITGGAILMSRLLNKIGKNKLYISESDNLEGYAVYKGFIKSPKIR